MPPDCFALSGLTDCAASTPQGVAWAGLFQPFGLKSRQCYSPLHDSVLKFVRLGARCARPHTIQLKPLVVKRRYLEHERRIEFAPKGL